MPEANIIRTTTPLFLSQKDFRKKWFIGVRKETLSDLAFLHYEDGRLKDRTSKKMDPKVHPLTLEEFVKNILKTPFLKDHLEEIEPLLPKK